MPDHVCLFYRYFLFVYCGGLGRITEDVKRSFGLRCTLCVHLFALWWKMPIDVWIQEKILKEISGSGIGRFQELRCRMKGGNN